VRIVRSHLFYPIDPNDGFIAYQDAGEIFLDKNAASKKITQYYTVFSYDDKGNVSSGAVVAVYPKGGSADVREVAPNTIDFDFSDVEVVQYGKVLDGTPLDAQGPFTIRIAYEKLPEHLKTITASLSHPDRSDLSFTFLLRINKDKTYYEASIAPLRSSGDYPTAVDVYDHEAQKLYTVRGVISAVYAEEEGSFLIPLGTTASWMQDSVVWIIFFLLLLLFLKLIHSAGKEHRATAAVRGGAFLGSFVVLIALAGVGAYFFNIFFSRGIKMTDAAAVLAGAGSVEPHVLFILAALLLCTLAVAYVVFFKKKN
jgi:hypothetical protein